MKCWMTMVAAGSVALGLLAPAGAQGEKPAPAQPGQPGARQGRRGNRTQWMKDTLTKLNLTPEQKTKVDKLLADSQAQTKKIREGGGSPEERRPKMREAMRATREKLNAILTPDQQAKFQQAARERRGNRGNRGNRGGRGQRAPGTSGT